VLWLSRNDYIYKHVYIKTRRRVLVNVTCVVVDVVVLVINRIGIQNKQVRVVARPVVDSDVVVTQITEIISKIK
jgi:hypothetical protein